MVIFFKMKFRNFGVACDWMKLESNLLKQINHSYNNQSWFQILIRHVIYAYIDTFRTNFHRFIFCPSLLHIQVHLYFMKSEPESTRISDANFIIVLTNSFPISQFLFFRIFRAFLYLIILTRHFVQKWNAIYSKKELNVVISEKYWTFGRDCFIIFDYQWSL